MTPQPATLWQPALRPSVLAAQDPGRGDVAPSDFPAPCPCPWGEAFTTVKAVPGMCCEAAR